MEIIVDVIGQKLKFPTNLKDYVDGSQNFVRFVFNLPSDWDNLKTFAQFEQNGVTYEVYLDEESSAYLPPEIIAGTCTLTLYGSNGDVAGTTNTVPLRVSKGVAVNSAKYGVTESLYQQLVSQFMEFWNWKEENEDEMILRWIDL